MGRMPRQGFAGLSGGPYLKQPSLCPPISSLSNQVFPGRVHLSMQVLQACQYHEEWKEPQGGQFYFHPIRDELF